MHRRFTGRHGGELLCETFGLTAVVDCGAEVEAVVLAPGVAIGGCGSWLLLHSCWFLVPGEFGFRVMGVI